MFSVDVQFTKSASQLERDLLRLLRDDIADRWTKALPDIRQEFVWALDDAILASDTYKALMPGGILSYEFGLPVNEAYTMVETIKDIWLSEVHLGITPLRVTHNNQISGGFRVRAINSNLENVLRSEAAKVTYYSKTYEKEVTLEYLRWLLTMGDSIIVDDYQVVLNPGLGRRLSRSGNALMFKLSGESSYSVNPSFSGTKSSNWTHKFLDKVKDDLERIIDKYI